MCRRGRRGGRVGVKGGSGVRGKMGGGRKRLENDLGGKVKGLGGWGASVCML